MIPYLGINVLGGVYDLASDLCNSCGSRIVYAVHISPLWYSNVATYIFSAFDTSDLFCLNFPRSVRRNGPCTQESSLSKV
jgi:hypothetical protein